MTDAAGLFSHRPYHADIARSGAQGAVPVDFENFTRPDPVHEQRNKPVDWGGCAVIELSFQWPSPMSASSL
jgi:hypothetical protein